MKKKVSGDVLFMILVSTCDPQALDEELAKASLVRTALENPRLKNQATKRVQRTDKLQDGLTPREVVSGKRARKTTKK